MHPAPHPIANSRMLPRRDLRQENRPHKNPHTPDGSPVTAEWLLMRLEEAGYTLLSLPLTGFSTRLRVSKLDWAPDVALLTSPSASGASRPPAPPPAQIDRMDETWTWLSAIPQGKFILRRVVGARSLIHPLTGRHIYPWRRLGAAVGADHKAVQRWHAQGVDTIVARLNGELRQ